MGDHPIAQLFAQLEATPSPRFEASLRARLVTELTTAAARVAGSPLEDMEDYIAGTIAPPVASTPPVHHSRRWLAAAAAAAVVVAGTIAVVVRDDGIPAPAGPPTSLVPGPRIADPAIDRLTSDGRSVWATGAGSTELMRIDPGKSVITDRFTLPAPAADAHLTFDGSYVDVITQQGVARFDRATKTFLPLADLGPDPILDVAATSDAVWVLRSTWTPERKDGVTRLERWDAGLTTRQTTVILGTAKAGGMTAGGGAIWVSLGEGANAVVEVNPGANHAVARIPNVGIAFSLAVADGSVWVPSYEDGTVARIDIATDTVTARIKVSADRAHSVAATDQAVWVTSFAADQVSVIDPKTNTVTASTKVNLSGAMSIAVAGQGAWVAGTGQARGIAGGT